MTLVERFDNLSKQEQELLAKKNGLPVEIVRKMLDDPTNSKTPVKRSKGDKKVLENIKMDELVDMPFYKIKR